MNGTEVDRRLERLEAGPDWSKISGKWPSRNSGFSQLQNGDLYGFGPENVGLIFPMIASHLYSRDNDQQKHWVQWGLAYFQTNPNLKHHDFT